MDNNAKERGASGAAQITLEDFAEAITRGVTRALAERALNPQPLPPAAQVQAAAGRIPGRPGLIIGVVVDPASLG